MFFHYFHDYEKIYKTKTEYIEGEAVEEEYAKYKVCKICGKAKEKVFDPTGFYWSPLSHKKASVILDKAVKIDGRFVIHSKKPKLKLKDTGTKNTKSTKNTNPLH